MGEDQCPASWPLLYLEGMQVLRSSVQCRGKRGHEGPHEAQNPEGEWFQFPRGGYW
jgi:hypothetical protein